MFYYIFLLESKIKKFIKENGGDLFVTIWGICGFSILQKWEPEIYEWHERRREWQREMIREHLLMTLYTS
jgi:hypothetical protein